MSDQPHKAGFVSIIGKPNVGKSTLMNALVGERLSIITSKAQTTRHRIMGVLSGDKFQIIYSDTPGILKPEYKLHDSMMSFVNSSFEDADVILFVADLYEKFEDEKQINFIKEKKVPVILVMNKMDPQKVVRLKIRRLTGRKCLTLMMSFWCQLWKSKILRSFLGQSLSICLSILDIFRKIL